MKISEFDFELPDELIAIRPVRPRSAARMLFSKGDHIRDLGVKDLPALIGPGDLLVFNDTKVIPARLNALRWRNGTAAKISVTLMQAYEDGTWSALLKPLKKVAKGERLEIGDGFYAIMCEKTAPEARLRFDLGRDDFERALAKHGQMPLPPYIASKRALDDRDRTDYQTIFAAHTGAVAAPTAALHFDRALRAACLNMGAEMAAITLHVGAGTFLPIKVDNILEHKMHAEWGDISAQTAEKINYAHARGGRVIAIGTTALRVLETAADHQGRVSAWSGNTDIFIAPGYVFKAVDTLMTNFHLPKSTLIVLIAAFVGFAKARAIYQHALSQRYRFYSYGDSSFLVGANAPLAKTSMHP